MDWRDVELDNGEWKNKSGDFLMQSVLCTNAKTIFEIGTRTGNSTRLLAHAGLKTGATVWTCDPIQYIRDDWVLKYTNIRFLIKGSDKIVWNKPIDILHIDGDHRFEGVYLDLVRFGDFVRKGGRIILHDAIHHQHGEDIVKAIFKWNRDETRKHTLKIYGNGDFGPYGIGVIYV